MCPVQHQQRFVPFPAPAASSLSRIASRSGCLTLIVRLLAARRGRIPLEVFGIVADHFDFLAFAIYHLPVLT